MRLAAEFARERFAAARVARLATASADGRPHIVPIVFALRGEVIYTAVDRKPKSTRALRRLENIAANRAVSALADHYDDDWDALWWVRADGIARIVDGEEAKVGVSALAARYPRYVTEPPPGPVLAIDVIRWSGWQARELS